MAADALAADGPNAAQIAYWNGLAGERWVDHQGPHDAMLNPLGERLMDAAGVAAGRRVLDIGCGTGSTTIEIARRVGPRGSVVGIDISAPMLARARERAADQPGLPIAFELADAETRAFAPASFDVAFSRYGAMFFRTPVTAFATVRQALRPAGRLGLLCWREVRRNDWAAVSIRVGGRHLDLPDPPGPEDPGPFSMKDPDRVRRLLRQAGYRDISIEPLDAEVFMGADLDEAVGNAHNVGPLANPILAAPAALRDRIAADLREALRPYVRETGVWMGSASWIVTARNG